MGYFIIYEKTNYYLFPSFDINFLNILVDFFMEWAYLESNLPFDFPRPHSS